MYKRYKYGRGIICLVSVCIYMPGYAVQPQGFSSFEQKGSAFTFSCPGQCALVFDERIKYDYTVLSGQLVGSGQLMFGFLSGNNVLSIQNVAINGSSSITSQRTVLAALPGIQNIPAMAKVIVLMQGKIEGNIFVQPGKFSFVQRIGNVRHDFFSFDTFKPYTINLVKGPMIGGISGNGMFYRVFFLTFLGALVYNMSAGKSAKSLGWILGIVGVGLWVVYDIRMGTEMMSYYTHDYKTYITVPEDEKVLRDRDDFYAFVSYVQRYLTEKDIKQFEEVGFFSDISRPYPDSMVYFLYPWRVSKNTEAGDYSIYYKSSKTPPAGMQASAQFSPHAFIYQTK